MHSNLKSRGFLQYWLRSSTRVAIGDTLLTSFWPWSFEGVTVSTTTGFGAFREAGTEDRFIELRDYSGDVLLCWHWWQSILTKPVATNSNLRLSCFPMPVSTVSCSDFAG